MGLLLINKAITNQDNYPMYFANMPDKTLFKKANVYSKTPTIPPQYVNVSNNQGVFILEDGRISDFCFSEGVYYIEEASSPAFIFGRCDKQTVDIDAFSNANFSFLGQGMQCIHINFRPINNVVIYPTNPIEYFFNGTMYMVDFSGYYSVKISDPFMLFAKIVNNNDGEYCVTDSFVKKLSDDLLRCILNEIDACAKQNVSPEDLQNFRNDIVNNAVRNVSFAKALGLSLTGVAIDDIGYTSGIEEVEEEPEPDMKRFSQFSVQPVMPIELPPEYQEPVEQPNNIVEDFDFNVETMQLNETEIESASEETPQQEDYTNISFDFSAYEVQSENPVENNAPQPFIQQPPQQEIQHFSYVPEVVSEEPKQLIMEQETEPRIGQQVPPMVFSFPQQVPPNTFESTVQSMQIQPKRETPKEVDVGIEGLNLSFSNMSVEKPINKPQNATIFSPFGEDNEWLCPNCLNEAIGDFCGFCGQRRATPFKVMLNTTDNSEWICRSCGSQNYLKFCSNCGQPKPIDNIQPQMKQPPKFCPSCGYSFANFQDTPKFCPECGLKF